MSTINYDLETNGQRRRIILLLPQPQAKMIIAPTRTVTMEAERSRFLLEPLPVSLLVVLLCSFSPVLFFTSADDEVDLTRRTARVSATVLFLLALPLSKALSTLLNRVSLTLGPLKRAPVSLRLPTVTLRALPSALTSHSPTVLTLAW
jgi:hypothetical protein